MTINLRNNMNLHNIKNLIQAGSKEGRYNGSRRVNLIFAKLFNQNSAKENLYRRFQSDEDIDAEFKAVYKSLFIEPLIVLVLGCVFLKFNLALGYIPIFLASYYLSVLVHKKPS